MLRHEPGLGDMLVPVETQRELSAELHARLRGFVHKRIGDSHAADDVAQEILIRLHRNLGDLRIEESLDAFAYRIARNAVIDYYRSRGSAREIPAEPESLIVQIGAGPPTGDASIDARGRTQLAGCLEPLIDRLAEPYRQALKLTDLGDFSQVEAARLVGVSVPGMKARVQRARLQVRERLTACCDVRLDETQRIAKVERSGACACASA